jgi:circadian clock protein KaiB
LIEYKLKLYIKSGSPSSDNTYEVLTQFYNNDSEGIIDISVIDINKNYKLAELDRILVVPTLIISMPLPERRIIGEITDIDMLIKVLGFKI